MINSSGDWKIGTESITSIMGNLESGIFIGSLIFGTSCPILSKALMTMKSTGISDKAEDFSVPLFLVFGMFLSMFMTLIVHVIIVKLKLKFPGYSHTNNNSQTIFPSIKFCLLLLIPSIFDISVALLYMMGLYHINVSVSQLMRGSPVIFLGLINQYILKRRLKTYQWVGIIWMIISIFLMCIYAILTTNTYVSFSSSHSSSSALHSHSVLSSEDLSLHSSHAMKPLSSDTHTLTGLALMLAGSLLQSISILQQENIQQKSSCQDLCRSLSLGKHPSPFLTMGIEGLWGVLIILFILVPAAYLSPGYDHKSFENTHNTIVMMINNPIIVIGYLLFLLTTCTSLLLDITFHSLVSTDWDAGRDSCRLVLVWVVSVVIFYGTSGEYGEAWSGVSWLELGSVCCMLYGCAVYSAPNPLSIRLTGGKLSCCVNCTEEYYEQVGRLPETEREPLDRLCAGTKGMTVSGIGTLGSMGGSGFRRPSPGAPPALHGARTAGVSNVFMSVLGNADSTGDDQCFSHMYTQGYSNVYGSVTDSESEESRDIIQKALYTSVSPFGIEMCAIQSKDVKDP